MIIHTSENDNGVENSDLYTLFSLTGLGWDDFSSRFPIAIETLFEIFLKKEKNLELKVYEGEKKLFKRLESKLII